MRHRRRGRAFDRSPSHRKAMFKNLASALFLTEREVDEELDPNPPKVKGRIITTLQKAKEVRPLVEKCITIARDALQHLEEAKQYATTAERNSEAWKQWRSSERWQQWNQAIAPSVTARRRLVQMIGDKQAVRVLFDEIAPRFADRDGGYTRILRLARTRIGDAGTRAALEFVGTHDRKVQRSEKPTFATETQTAAESDASAAAVPEAAPAAPAPETASGQ